MAEGFCGGPPDRTLCRLRILFGVGLILLGVLILPRGARHLFRGFLCLAAAFVGTEATGLLRRALIRERAELVSMVLGAGAIGCLAGATGGAESPFLSLLVAPVFMYGFSSGGAGVSVAALVSVTVSAVLSLVAVADGALGALLGPAAVAGVIWLGARAVAATTKCANAQSEELLRLAQRDPLTRLLNRRSLNELVRRLVAEGRQFTLVLVDLDGFKRVNDRHGHLLGDRVLQRVAEAMQKAVRREDAIARYGGDEFAVVVPGSREDGEMVMRRLREAVESAAQEAGVATGLSGGVAAWPEDGATLEELLHAADRMLYGAKRDGKDGSRETRVRVCSS